MDNGWTKRLAELENELKLNTSMLAKQTDLAREAEIQRDDWKREWRLLIKELEMLINFVPDGWEMPLGWSDLVAQVRGKRHDDAQAAAWERKQERERTAREFTERALLK